ncbi:MAG: hypothetical protein JW860_11965 [Sedimentisphaerales bacterium]|nr:hypothetical protein [Sedimentisphaerales bacterium]
MNNQTHLYVAFENLLRNGQTLNKAALKGKIAVVMDISLDAREKVLAVLAANKKVLLVTTTRIQCYSPDGKQEWSRPKSRVAEAVIKDNQIFYQNNHLFLESVTLNNKLIMSNLPIPSAMSEEAELQLLVPLEKQFLNVVQFYDKMEDYDAQYYLNFNEYGSPTCEWGHKAAGMMALPPLYNEKSSQMILAGPQNIHIFDAKTGDEQGNFPLPMPELYNWSGSPEGLLYFLGKTDDKDTLMAVDTKGEIKWRWSPPQSKGWITTRHPILTPDGKVCVLDENTIWCIKDGNEQWKVETTTPGYGCSLPDGSVLATIANKLIHLTPDGRENLSVDLKDTPITPPTLNDQGEVLLATDSKILRIE